MDIAWTLFLGCLDARRAAGAWLLRRPVPAQQCHTEVRTFKHHALGAHAFMHEHDKGSKHTSPPA